MTTTEAYELTLEKVKELREQGIETVITSCPSKDTIKEGKKENIPPEKWVHVTFRVKDEGDVLKVREASNYLGMCGITFDTGGWTGNREWELDWSFEYTGKEDEQWQDAIDDVENLIKNQEQP